MSSISASGGFGPREAKVLRTTLVCLLSLPGVGPHSVRECYRANAEAFFVSEKATPELVRLVNSFARRRSGILNEGDLDNAYRRAVQLIDESAECGIEALSFADPQYPQRLMDLSDAPLVLFARGSMEALNPSMAVAVIGTREPSRYGRSAAHCFGSMFGGLGAVVVSGLALGCDTAAHEGALDAGARTLAILAHGLDMVYPSQNRGLAARIAEEGGCLLSEYAIGETPNRYRFVERDRLQSGCSDGVIIAEAGLRSGTMHAARAAIKQGRLLACEIPPPGAEAGDMGGNLALVDQGDAMALRGLDDYDDLIAELKCRNETTEWRTGGLYDDV